MEPKTLNKTVDEGRESHIIAQRAELQRRRKIGKNWLAWAEQPKMLWSQRRDEGTFEVRLSRLQT